ncbi:MULTISPECIES: hypothetical protein [Vibrio]|uniref:hypothetical protein n=1 Tax=Vibrio TaxID=662 RepID=UPI0005A6AB65|nr:MULTISPECIES: hypothetical protein [Vibrio]MCF7483174.1 hypothetical protein [Vibrio sp. J1-1]
MKKVQFFTNGEVTTYVDQNSATSLEEEKQLFAQGFVMTGDVIETNEISDALKLHKENYGSDVKDLSVLGILGGLGSVI